MYDNLNVPQMMDFALSKAENFIGKQENNTISLPGSTHSNKVSNPLPHMPILDSSNSAANKI